MIEANKKIVDFLNITMDLNTGKFEPFNKPNNKPQYVHSNLNHPPSIIKNIPTAINKRLFELSSNQETLNTAKLVYQEALSQRGYKYQLKYPYTNNNNKSKKNRGKKVIWFNPPYNSNVKTNIGQSFFKTVKKFFQHPPSVA